MNYIDYVLSEVRKEIILLKSKEFGEWSYFFDSKVGGICLNWIPDLGRFSKCTPFSSLTYNAPIDGNPPWHGP